MFLKFKKIKVVKHAKSRRRFLYVIPLVFCAVISSFAGAASQRIVSLAPSATEWIDALGLTSALVGVTEQCDFPPAVLKIDKVGAFMRVSVESVLAKKPTDIVTVDGLPVNMRQRFASNGIRVHVFNARRLDEFPAEIRKLGDALGASDRGKLLSEKMSMAFDQNDKRKAQNTKKESVLIAVSLQPIFVASAQNWMSDLFERAGYINAMRNAAVEIKSDSDFLQISLEAALKMSAKKWVLFVDSKKNEPDVRKKAEKILLRASMRSKPDLWLLPADILTRPGPRLLEALRLIEDRQR